jgi:hypothetical protein
VADFEGDDRCVDFIALPLRSEIAVKTWHVAGADLRSGVYESILHFVHPEAVTVFAGNPARLDSHVYDDEVHRILP